MTRPLLLAALALLTAPVDACSGCDSFDCGTCGGSPCCSLEFDFGDATAADVSAVLAKVLLHGDLPGQYTPVDFQCAGADLPKYSFNPAKITPTPGLREPDAPIAQCLATMTRRTSGDGFFGIKFQDRVNFVVDDSSLRAFSVSEKASPDFRCDWGQNYENILVPLRRLAPSIVLTETKRVGCSIPRPADAPDVFAALSKPATATAGPDAARSFLNAPTTALLIVVAQPCLPRLCGGFHVA